MQEEDKKSHSAGDCVTWNTVHEDGRTLPSSGLPSKLICKEYFSTKQQEMDMQLQALQNISENMEQDFRNTRVVSSDCQLLCLTVCFVTSFGQRKNLRFGAVSSNLLSVT